MVIRPHVYNEEEQVTACVLYTVSSIKFLFVFLSLYHQLLQGVHATDSLNNYTTSSLKTNEDPGRIFVIRT